MTLTAEEIAAIIGVLVVLGNAVAVYLSHQSTAKNIDALHTKVDAVGQAVDVAPTPPSVGPVPPPPHG